METLRRLDPNFGMKRDLLVEACQHYVSRPPTEHEAYGIITEALIMHKLPSSRFKIFPQLKIHWSTTFGDKRSEIPDFIIGEHIDDSKFRVCGGAEAKTSNKEMVEMPSGKDMALSRATQEMIDVAYLQSLDQVKSAIKQRYVLNRPVPWLLFAGPYFTMVEIGPFTSEQLRTRIRKPNNSGDFMVTSTQVKTRTEVRENLVYPLYLLGTDEAFEVLERFFLAVTKVRMNTGYVPDKKYPYSSYDSESDTDDLVV